MDADILNEVGNILGLQTGLSPNCSLQAAYNIVYTSLQPPFATLSFLRDSVSYTREGNCRLIQLGRDGSSPVDRTRETAGRNMVKIIQEMWNRTTQRVGKSLSRSSALSLTLPGNSSCICTAVYSKPQVLTNEKLQTNQNVNLLTGYLVINLSIRRVYCV